MDSIKDYTIILLELVFFFKKYLEPRKIDMRGSYKFKYIEVKSNRKRALLEAYTAGMLCPAHFGTGEKKS